MNTRWLGSGTTRNSGAGLRGGECSTGMLVPPFPRAAELGSPRAVFRSHEEAGAARTVYSSARPRAAVLQFLISRLLIAGDS
jgi:hypothetical protein